MSQFLRRPARLFVVALFLALFTPAPAHAGYKFPLTVRSNTTYDGGGARISAAHLSRVFNIWSVSNVTIRNFIIVGDGGTRVFDMTKASNIRIENIKIESGAGDVAHVHLSSDITISKLTADTIDRYLLWVDNSSNVRLLDSTLTRGSKLETGVRIFDHVTGFTMERCTIRALINKKTSVRLHDGSNYIVRNCTLEGQVWPGPMGGGNGGQNLSGAARKAELDKRTKNVLFDNVNIIGSLGPQAGLSGFVMRGGSITAKAESPYFNFAYGNVTWRYPQGSNVRSGDIIRPAPSGYLQNVRIIAPGRKTLNFGGNGPLNLFNVTLNGKSIFYP
jgi:hypothetical protein